MGIVTDIFLPIALAFIMLSLGLGLTGADFLRIIKQPKDFFVGTISQIILLPIIAFALVKVWAISPELAVGVMIIAAAPGGVTSNILTSFAKGDVALSISLTAIISLLSVITIPFIIFASLNLLEAVKNHCKDSVFIHLSTNKVYGDRPNKLDLIELDTRWEYTENFYRNNAPLHGLFKSKVPSIYLNDNYYL